MANIGEPMRRHHVIPLDHPIPATTEPTPLLVTGDKTRDAALAAAEVTTHSAKELIANRMPLNIVISLANIPIKNCDYNLAPN